VRGVDGLLAALAQWRCGARVLDAFAPDEPVAVVGGAVRDLLLGRVPREADLVTEGDVAAHAARLGRVVAAHERFGTATVETAGCRFDLVRARTETYPEPGALPVVAPAAIEEDLARRDVTVNAMALRLDGTLLAVPGAREDLEAGVLRVLHDRSFADDATRLWRVARYAARLGFAVEAHTAALAAEADPATVGGDRLGNELRLALREPDPPAALAAAQALNARLLPPGFAPRPAGLQEALALLPPEGRRDLLVLAACCAGMDARALLDWLDAMGFPAAERDLVAAASRASTLAPLRRARTAAEVWRAARGAPLEAVALAGGEGARRWLAELRHVRLEIDGRDLLAAGVPQGPEVGARLERAMEARLAGRAPGREAQLRAALEG
jgi:tRNA nucleotidyltransferase (CCA-adding enzyme)